MADDKLDIRNRTLPSSILFRPISCFLFAFFTVNLIHPQRPAGGSSSSLLSSPNSPLVSPIVEDIAFQLSDKSATCRRYCAHRAFRYKFRNGTIEKFYLFLQEEEIKVFFEDKIEKCFYSRKMVRRRKIKNDSLYENDYGYWIVVRKTINYASRSKCFLFHLYYKCCKKVLLLVVNSFKRALRSKQNPNILPIIIFLLSNICRYRSL